MAEVLWKDYGGCEYRSGKRTPSGFIATGFEPSGFKVWKKMDFPWHPFYE